MICLTRDNYENKIKYLFFYSHNLILKWTNHRSRFHRCSKYSFVAELTIVAALSVKSADQCIFILPISILIPQFFSLNGWNQTNFYILLQTFQIMQISKRLCSGLESVVKKSCHQWCSLQSKEKSALEKQHMVDLRCQGIPQKSLTDIWHQFSYTESAIITRSWLETTLEY